MDITGVQQYDLMISIISIHLKNGLADCKIKWNLNKTNFKHSSNKFKWHRHNNLSRIYHCLI